MPLTCFTTHDETCMSTFSMEGPFYHILSIVHEEKKRRDGINRFVFNFMFVNLGNDSRTIVSCSVYVSDCIHA